MTRHVGGVHYIYVYIYRRLACHPNTRDNQTPVFMPEYSNLPVQESQKYDKTRGDDQAPTPPQKKKSVNLLSCRTKWSNIFHLGLQAASKKLGECLGRCWREWQLTYPSQGMGHKRQEKRASTARSTTTQRAIRCASELSLGT